MQQKSTLLMLLSFITEFPKNCSAIADSKKDKYGFCKGEPEDCIAQPDGEDFCYCDVGCINNDRRTCCEDVGMYELKIIKTNIHDQ